MSEKHKTLFIHIGPHKTGSTYLQRMLVNNRTSLAHLGLNYPSDGQANRALDAERGDHECGHHEIAEQIQKYGSSHELEKVLNSSERGAILLSSENFDDLTQSGVSYLHSEVRGRYTCKIIYFIRRPDDLIFSHWQESVKHGSDISCSDFLLRQALKPFSSRILNHELVIRPFGNLFGYENILLLDYDYFVQSKRDIFEFLASDVFKLDGVLAGTAEVINRSLPYEKTELIRAINGTARAQGLKTTENYRVAYLREQNNLRDLSDMLESSIRETSVEIDISHSYFFESLRAHNDSALSKCQYVTHYPTSYPSKTRAAPTTNWLLKQGTREKLLEIFEHLKASVQIENHR